MEAPRQKRDQQLWDLIRQVRKHEFPYTPRPAKPRDWAAYTQAQVEEIHDTLRHIRQAVDAVPDEPPVEHPSRGRPPEYAAKDLAKTLLMQQYFEASNRVAQGYALLFAEKLGLTRVPPYKQIERAYEDAGVRRVLDAVFVQTQAPLRGRIEALSPDGTGLPRTGKANWEQEKTSKAGADAKRARFDGSVIMVALPQFLATAHSPLVVGFQNESPTLQPLLAATAAHQGGRLDGIHVVGDAAFPSRPNCDFIAKLGATPFLFPRVGFTLDPRGSQAWRAMLDGFLDRPQAWLRAYHVRSASESFNSRHKRRHPTPLRKILARRRETEKHARFVVDNLTQVGYLRHVGGLGGAWPGSPAG